MRIALFGLIILLAAPSIRAGSTFGLDGLTFKAGLGYEFLSQDFYLDSLDQAGVDSLDITTTLKTTYLDDLKGQLRFGYNPSGTPRLSLDGVYEQTSDQQRLRAYVNHGFAAGPFKIDWNGEGDFREGRVDPVKGDPGYVSGNGRARIALPVARNTTLWARLRGDRVHFDSTAEGAYNYSRAGAELGASQFVSDFSIVSGSAFVVRRFVPDSPTEEYRSAGADLSFAGALGEGDLDIVTHYESRNYAHVGSLDDYRRWDLTLRDHRSLGASFFSQTEFEIEILAFDTTVYLTDDYSRLELALLAGFDRLWGSIAAGPHLALLSETQSDAYTVGEDYIEFGIKTQFDLIRPGQALVSLESTAGQRSLKDEGTTELVQTDFTFERLNLLVDWVIVERIGISLLLSGEWEWHDRTEDNSRLMLFTSGLTYTF